VTIRINRAMRAVLGRAASTAAVVVISVVMTLVAQRIMAPAPAGAQFISTPEVRAQSFVLVSSDGTTIARLGPGSQGAGNLTLFDATGRLRMAASGAGDLLAYGNGGTALAQIYANAETNDSGLLLRDSSGTLRVIASQSDNAAAVRVQDAAGNQRVGIGTLADLSGAGRLDYGLRVRGEDGGVLSTIP
jgi:hypothetical protein